MLSIPRHNQDVREFSLRQLVGPLFRRKTLLTSVFLTVLLATVLAGIFVPPPYKARMAVLVDRERHDPLVSTEATTQVPQNATSDVSVEEINSEAELLLSQDLLERVVLATGLNNRHSLMDYLVPAKSDQERIERAVKRLASKLKIKNETNSNLIEISYISDDPRLTYSVLSSLGAYYVQKHAAVHRPPGSSLFFELQTQRYLNALKQSEAALKDFSQKEGVAAPDVERTDLALQVATTIGQVYTAQQAVAGDQRRIQEDMAQLKATPQRATTQQATTPADKLLEDLGASLLAAETKRTQLALKYDPQFPLVLEADQEIADARAAIAEAEKTRYVSQTTDVDPAYELLREDLSKTRSDLATQQATETAGTRSVAAIHKQMVTLNDKALAQQDLLREVKANEDNYLLYQAKREQERTSDALDQTRIGNVAIAVPPAIPALPLYSLPVLILIGFAGAVFLSVGAVYTKDYFDSSFHTPSQVTNILGIPVVISMPRKTA